MPSRDKLRAFVNHVRTLTQKDDNGDDGFDREYKSIKDLQLTIKDNPQYPVNDGRLPCNKKKNRYKDIIPFDFCRVALTPTQEEGSDYINASFLQDVNGQNGYIAAMGPLTATLDDYWRMLWEYGIRTIVMVCKEVELGKKKCAKYWPDAETPVVAYAGVTIRMIEESRQCEEIEVRIMEAEFSGERRQIYHYHFQSWPDHGVPESAQPIVDLIQTFRHQQATNDPPIVVHCSAGCGRTGTVCAVDYAWQLLESQIESDVSVLDIVTLFRHQRLSMVQTKDQYVLIYKAVLKLVKSYLAAKSKTSVVEPPALPEPEAPQPPAPQEDIYQNVAAQGGIEYGAQSTALAPKPAAPPPIPPTKRVSAPPTPEPMTNIDDVTLTPEQEEELKQLQIRMTDSSQRRPSFLGSYEDEHEEDNDEEPPPPVPVRTEGANQLVSVVEVDERFMAVEDTSYAEVPRMSRPASRSDLHPEESGPPPSLPARTSDSYVFTEEERAPDVPADRPKVPTSPRPSQGNLVAPGHLSPSGRPLSTGASMEAPVVSSAARSSTPTTGAGNSHTLPSSGRHGESPTAQASASSSVISSTRGVFKKIVGKGARNQRTASGAPMSISSPVGTDGGDMSKLHVSQSSHTGGGRPTVPVFSDDMGFKNRVPRPQGPRPMPANWRVFT